MRRNASEGDYNDNKNRFNIEKIAKIIKAEHVVKKLMYKYVDPLILRRTSLFQKCKKDNSICENNGYKYRNEFNDSCDNSNSNSSGNSSSNNKEKVHYKNIRLQNSMFKLYNPLPQKVFPFVPKLERSFVINKKRPYQYILNSNNVSNEIDSNNNNNDMFQKANFSKIIKVSSICNHNNNNNNEHNNINNNNNISIIKQHPLNNKYLNKILNDFTNTNIEIQINNKSKRNRRQYNIPKLAQIAKMTLKYSMPQCKDDENKFKCNKVDYYFGNERFMKGTKSMDNLHRVMYYEGNTNMKNRDILFKNNNISINCINSSIDSDIHKDQLIGRNNKHKVMNISNDVSFLRIKNMENELKKLINSKE